MSNRPLPFSHPDYDKLQHKVFPTLRRRDKFGSVGDVRDVVVGPKGDRKTWGTAKVIAKEKVTLNDLPTSFLCWDTDTEVLMMRNDREKAVESLNSFYQNPIKPTDEELTLYWNQWVETNEQVRVNER